MSIEVKMPVKDTFVEVEITAKFPDQVLWKLAITEPSTNPTKWLKQELEELVTEYNHRLYELMMPKTRVRTRNDKGQWQVRGKKVKEFKEKLK